MLAGILDPTDATLPRPEPAAGGRYALDDAACCAVLEEVGWGVLSAVERVDAAVYPYAVPVAYAFDGEAVYVATGPGRKLRALERLPRLCLTVSDVRGLAHWRSVVVVGTARWLTDPGARGAAIRAFARQRRCGGRALTSRDGARLLAARILRVDVREVGGRACGAWDGVPAPAPTRRDAPPRAAAATPAAGAAEAGRAMDSLRRMVRALRASGAAAERELGVSAAQLFVLRQVAARPGQSMRELADRVLTTPSSVSEVVARLVALGLVERRAAAEDRRRAELMLTAAGQAVLERSPETVQERLTAGFRRLPEGERRAIAEGLESWLAEAGLGDVPASMFLEPDAEA